MVMRPTIVKLHLNRELGACCSISFNPSMVHQTFCAPKLGCFPAIACVYCCISFSVGKRIVASGSFFNTSITILRPNRRYVDRLVIVSPKIICRTAIDPRVRVHASTNPRQSTALICRLLPQGLVFRVIVSRSLQKGVNTLNKGANFLLTTLKELKSKPVRVIIP